MQKNWWVRLALLLIVPGFLLTVSCAQQPAGPDTGRDGSVSATPSEGEGAGAIETSIVETAAEPVVPMDSGKDAFLNKDVLFEFDSAALTDTAQMLLREKAEWLKKNSHVHVVVEGHCDERGTTEYNLGLGERRAVSARDFLNTLGISLSRLDTISYGEEMPVDTAKNENAYRRNRRAHMALK